MEKNFMYIFGFNQKEKKITNIFEEISKTLSKL